MRNWTDAKVLVTGAGRGIGQAAALAMASRGAHVVAVGRSLEHLETTARLALAMPGRVETFSADIADASALGRLKGHLEARVGRLDVVVHAAGILGPMGPLAEASLPDWRETIDINLTGAFAVAQATANLLAEGHAPMALFLSSSVGRQVRAGWGAYAVSKWALEGLVSLLAQEWRAQGIIAVSVNPGGTATDMRREAYPEEDPSTLPTPGDVAETLAWLSERLGMDASGRRYSSRTIMGLMHDANLEPGAIPFERMAD